MVILAEFLKNSEILLGWKTCYNDLQVLQCQKVILKIYSLGETGKLVDIHGGLDIVEE